MFEQNKIAKVFEACEGSGCDGYLIARISDQVEFFFVSFVLLFKKQL